MTDKNPNIIDRGEEYHNEFWIKGHRDKGFRFAILDYEDFHYFLKKSDMVMCKRNSFRRNSEFYTLLYGYDNSEDELAAACIIENPEPRKLFIKLFEVSPSFYRQGFGTKLFNMVKDWNHDRWHWCTYELESLDDESDAFWESLGFEEFINEEGETRMRKVII